MKMHKRLLVTVGISLVAAATGTSPAWAKWGCAARGAGTTWSNNYAYDTEAAARADATAACKAAFAKANPRRPGADACHITGCDANVDTAEQTLATWPAPAPVTVKCGVKYGTKC